jgi:hypothetical protein
MVVRYKHEMFNGAQHVVLVVDVIIAFHFNTLLALTAKKI